MNVATSQPVVAGVDGSEPALAAARWAARRAKDLDGSLRLIAATGRVETDPWARSLVGSDARSRRAHAAATQALDGAVVEARKELSGDRITTVVVHTTPARALHEESTRAGLLVVGHRGRGGFAEMLLGSVAVTAASTAQCPVVVLRGVHTPGGPIVVGIDGPERCEAAVGAAFAEARLRAATLLAIHAWTDEIVDPYAGRLVERQDRLRDERRVLTEVMAPWAEKFPDVEIREHVVHGVATAVLVTASADAQLLVVGLRGRSGPARLVLGSVSRAVLHHAHCPVLVARG